MAKPVVREVTRFVELSGRTEAVGVVEVRARVEGILLEALVEPGSVVSEGDILFRIDPSLFIAKRDAAAAGVQRAEALLGVAGVRLQGIRRASELGASNEIEVFEAKAALDTAAADLEVARRELTIQQLSVDYTDVRAPMSGEVEDGAPDIGSLVGGIGSGLLTRIYDTSRVRVWITVPDRLYLRASLPRRGEGDELSPLAYPIEVATEADEGYPHTGVIDYVDPSVDRATGTIRLRATVPNPKGDLKPGLFVRCRLVAEKIEGAMLVPEASINRGQTGAYLLVIGDDGLVEARPVDLGVRDGTMRVIESGLGPDERVIVRGIIRARPGQPVSVIDEPLGAAGAETP